jgi:hypothetical protein
MIKTIRAKDVLPLLDKAVEERGAEWVYPDSGDCKYAFIPEDYDLEYARDSGYDSVVKMVEFFGDTFGPACLVGYVFNELDPGFLSALCERHDNGETVEHLNLVDGFTVGDTTYAFTQKAVAVLSAGQAVQDVGGTWGTANERAHEEFKRFKGSS